MGSACVKSAGQEKEGNMAQEAKRGCGFRHVGSVYLVGDGVWGNCDRLPMEIKPCPGCGHFMRPGRALTSFNPQTYFKDHKGCGDNKFSHCLVCQPADEAAFIQSVGIQHYPKASDFSEEAHRLGVSRCVNWKKLPKGFKLGVTPVYLSHDLALETMLDPETQPEAEPLPGFEPDKKKHKRDPNQPRLLDAPRVEKKPAVFMVFIPQRLEKLIYAKDATPKALKEMEKAGITPVVIANGDKDHAPKIKKGEW